MKSQDGRQPKKDSCRVISFVGGLTLIIPPSMRMMRHPFGMALIDPFEHVVAWLAVNDQDDYGNPLPRWEFNSGLDGFHFSLMDNVEDMLFEYELIDSQ
jgi:hypothetical protein